MDFKAIWGRPGTRRARRNARSGSIKARTKVVVIVAVAVAVITGRVIIIFEYHDVC